MHISLSAGEMAKKSQILRKSQTRTTILEGRIIVIHKPFYYSSLSQNVAYPLASPLSVNGILFEVMSNLNSLQLSFKFRFHTLRKTLCNFRDDDVNDMLIKID